MCNNKSWGLKIYLHWIAYRSTAGGFHNVCLPTTAHSVIDKWSVSNLQFTPCIPVPILGSISPSPSLPPSLPRTPKHNFAYKAHGGFAHTQYNTPTQSKTAAWLLNFQKLIEACGLFILFPLRLTNRNPLRMQFHEWVHLGSPLKVVCSSFSVTVAAHCKVMQIYAYPGWISPWLHSEECYIHV